MAEWMADAAALAPGRAYDLKLVLSEATTNAVEHTVVPGDVEIVAWLLSDRLVVEITNPGSFQPGLSKDTDDRQRGLGLPLMVSLSDQVHVSRLPGEKTRVSVTFFREQCADHVADAGPAGPATAVVLLEAERLKVQAALAEVDRQAAAARTVEALRLSQERLRLALKNAQIAIYAVDREQRFLWAENPEGALEGRSPTGTAMQEAFLSADDEQLVEARRRVIASGVGVRVECPIVVEGRSRVFEHSIEPLRDASGDVTGVLVAAVDITRRRRAEEHVRRHGLLLETVTDAIIASDEHFIIRSWNRAAERLYGWSEQEVLGRPVGSFLMIDTPDEERRRVRQELLRDGRWSGEMIERRKDGSPIWIQSAVTLLTDPAGNWTGAVAVNRDVTERTRAEAARRDSEDRVQMALRAADMGAWDYHLDTSEVFWDERARDMWGVRRGDRIDFDEAVARIHPEDRRTVVGALEDAAAGVAGGVYDQEFRVVWADGSAHWIASHGQVQFAGEDGSCRPVRLVGVLREITSQKSDEDQHARLMAEQQILTERLAAANEELMSQNQELIVTDRGLREANAFAKALSRVNESLTSTLEREEMLRRVVTEGSRALGCPRAALELRERGSWVVGEVLGLPERLRGLHLTPEQASVANAMVSAGDVLAIEDSRLDAWVGASAILRYGSQAVLAVPLVVRDQVMGSLQFIWTDGPRRFEASEVDFARKLSTSIALSLENARLFAEQRTIADTLQQALLSVPEQLPGLSFGHLHRSATELTDVGGDFYDLFPLPRGRVGIILGDVSGRGIAAADLAALVKNTLKAYAYRSGSPARVLIDTNRLLLQSITGDLFVTAFFGTVQMETGALSFSNAGHPPAFLVGLAGGEVCSLEHRGPVLGLFPEAKYTNAQVDLLPGDRLILYTDGLTEARRDSEFLGETRLKLWLEKACGIPTPGLPERLLQHALDFTGGRLTDDLAILALERTVEA